MRGRQTCCCLAALHPLPQSSGAGVTSPHPRHLPLQGAQGNGVYLQIRMLLSQMREIIRGWWSCQQMLFN